MWSGESENRLLSLRFVNARGGENNRGNRATTFTELIRYIIPRCESDDGEMKGEDQDADIPASFQQAQGFPTAEPDSPFVFGEARDQHGYQYCVEEPHPVDHAFPKPPEPEAPETRAELEQAVPQYVKFVLKEYGLELEYDRLTVGVSGRFRKALGKCGPAGYKHPRIRISSKHYVDRGYLWERCKETIRHELAHAWQIRWLGYSSHGPTFRMKAQELDCKGLSRYDGETEPKYVAYCQSCGGYFKRHRSCRAVRAPSVHCGDCGTGGYELDWLDGDRVWKVFENTDWYKVME